MLSWVECFHSLSKINQRLWNKTREWECGESFSTLRRRIRAEEQKILSRGEKKRKFEVQRTDQLRSNKQTRHHRGKNQRVCIEKEIDSFCFATISQSVVEAHGQCMELSHVSPCYFNQIGIFSAHRHTHIYILICKTWPCWLSKGIMSSASSDYDINGDENVRGKTPPVVLESGSCLQLWKDWNQLTDSYLVLKWPLKTTTQEKRLNISPAVSRESTTPLPASSLAHLNKLWRQHYLPIRWKMFVLFSDDDQRWIPIILGPTRPDLPERRRKRVQQFLLPRYPSQLSCLAVGCHFRHEQTEVCKNRVNAFNCFLFVRLKKWWWEIFPDLNCPDLHIKHCPMLIGIMRRAPREQTESSPFEYQFQVLQRSDLLVQTGQKSTFTNVLQTLKVFREEWHRNEQFLLPSDISRSNFLCPDVVIEIVKYLSLPDAIHAFSIGILSMLRQEQTKIHLDNPSHRFLQMIPQHFDPRRIASLRVTDDFRSSDHNLSLLRTFDQLLHLTVVSQRKTHLINRLLGHLPNVRFVSLLLDEAINCDHFGQLKQALRDHSATHLRIRCADVSCGHPRDDDSLEHYIQNTSITSCVFDFGHDPMHSRRQCRRKDPFCFFDSAMKFIETMINVRRVQFMTVRSQIETFLQVLLWEKLISRCIHLDRVVIKVLDVGDYTQEAANIEQELRRTRPGISFLVKSG